VYPALTFDRTDDLHHAFTNQVIGDVPASIPINYVPSVEKYAEFLMMGMAYGMLPDLQSTPLAAAV